MVQIDGYYTTMRLYFGARCNFRHGPDTMKLATPFMRPALCVLAATLSACAATPVGKVDFDADHDFSTYRSFGWISEQPMKVGPVAAAPRESLEPRIKSAIRAHLERKGFTFAEDAAAADFAVSFTVGSREQSRPDGYPAAQAGGRWTWGTEYHGGAAGATYTQGVLAIDVFDVNERRPVWHGAAAKRIDVGTDGVATAQIESVVASILAGFPP